MTTRSERQRLYRTRQRRVVLNTLTQMAGFVSAQDLHALLYRTGERVGLATVYRTLHTYVDMGRIETVHSATGEQLFRWCPHPGCTYFLVCTRCGKRLPIDIQPILPWATSVATEHGYTDIDIICELTGTCETCARPDTEARQPG
jgi:Fur family ferric uptake transcriptional regulator